MKKILPILFMAVLALVAVPAHADTTTCPTGPLTTYLVSGFSCATGTLTFSNFSWAPGGTNTPTAASVGVTPITTGVDGFSFNPSLSVNNSALGPAFIQQSSDLTIFYTVTGGGITDLELGFNGAFSGAGSSEVTEMYCLGFASLSGCSVPHVIQVTNPPANFSQTVTFAPVNVLSVSKDIEQQAGPIVTVILSGGLLGLRCWSQKRLSRFRNLARRKSEQDSRLARIAFPGIKRLLSILTRFDLWPTIVCNSVA